MRENQPQKFSCMYTQIAYAMHGIAWHRLRRRHTIKSGWKHAHATQPLPDIVMGCTRWLVSGLGVSVPA